MSLLDDAKRLAAARITSDGTVWCHFCEGMIEAPETYDPPMPLADQHDPTCPWLAMPRIVAVLEAAERVIADQEQQGGPWKRLGSPDYYTADAGAVDALKRAVHGV